VVIAGHDFKPADTPVTLVMAAPVVVAAGMVVVALAPIVTALVAVVFPIARPATISNRPRRRPTHRSPRS
jgi:hypothetical protein